MSNIKRRGNSYQWRYFYRDGNGRRSSKSGTAPTRRAAADALAASQAETIRTGRNANTTITLADYASEWFATYETLGLRASTVYATRIVIRAHIVPRLGAMRLTELKTRDVAGWITDLGRDGRRDGGGGLGAKTIRNAYGVLAAMLEDAAANDLIARNPCDGVRLPRVERSALRVWDRWQLATFLVAARDARDPMYPIWRLIADTGMRRGEVLGLRWDEVDAMATEITITRTRVRVGGRMMASEPKTRAGRRVITVAAETIEELTRLRERQEALAAQLEMPPTAYVCAMDDGRPMDANALRRRWNKAVARAGVPAASAHRARHTVPTVQLEDGVPIHIVAGRTGHANGAVTLKLYAEYLPRADRDAAQRHGDSLADAMREMCAECVPTTSERATLTDTERDSANARAQ